MNDVILGFERSTSNSQKSETSEYRMCILKSVHTNFRTLLSDSMSTRTFFAAVSWAFFHMNMSIFLFHTWVSETQEVESQNEPNAIARSPTSKGK